jgi:hypothetical protein
LTRPTPTVSLHLPSLCVSFLLKKIKIFQKETGSREEQTSPPFFLFSLKKMDDYTREMMDLKTLVTRTLEKKGVLAKIRVITQFSFWFSFYIDDKLKSRRIILIVNF